MSDTDEILVKVCEFGPMKSGNDVTLTLNKRNGFRREPKSTKFKSSIGGGMK
jgi:hypothetical protein